MLSSACDGLSEKKKSEIQIADKVSARTNYLKKNVFADKCPQQKKSVVRIVFCFRNDKKTSFGSNWVKIWTFWVKFLCVRMRTTGHWGFSCVSALSEKNQIKYADNSKKLFFMGDGTNFLLLFLKRYLRDKFKNIIFRVGGGLFWG